MADDRCPQCGASLALVGRLHRCLTLGGVKLGGHSCGHAKSVDIRVDIPVDTVPAATMLTEPKPQRVARDKAYWRDRKRAQRAAKRNAT
jgi:hypothetical protein